MTKLSVNINKIATLRNARGGNYPNVVEAAINIQQFGADGITVHPRPDERHIRYNDVYDLKTVVYSEFNIEGYPSEKFLKVVDDVRPNQVTLVPDPPEVLTSNAGWDTITHKAFLADVIQRLKSQGMRVSLFMENDLKMIDGASALGADRIELYTESYASHFPINKEEAIAPYIKAAKHAFSNGLGINAGHDLNLQNIGYFSQSINNLLEVSIGHAIIADALYFGLSNAVQMYKKRL